MAARLVTTLCLLPLAVQALESLDDREMSGVVAQDGVVLRSEYDVSIDSIQYFDDDNNGSISLQNARIATHDQQVIDIDIVDGTGDRAGRNGIRLTNDELPFDFTVDTARINGNAIGSFGLTGFTTGGVSPIITDIWAGGYDENNNNVADEAGFTVDVYVPKESSYTTYYEDDGTRLSATVDYCSSFSGNTCLTGGINLRGLTVDVVSEGIRIGLPTVQNGVMNVRDFNINGTPINDISFENINIPEGGYAIVSAPENAGEVAINLDAYIAPETSFDYVFFDTSDSDVQRVSASISLDALASDQGTPATDFFRAEDVSVNVLQNEPTRDRGIFVAIGDATNGTGGVRGSVFARDIVLRPESAATAPVLGSAQLNLEILPGSYVEILGH